MIWLAAIALLVWWHVRRQDRLDALGRPCEFDSGYRLHVSMQGGCL